MQLYTEKCIPEGERIDWCFKNIFITQLLFKCYTVQVYTGIIPVKQTRVKPVVLILLCWLEVQGHTDSFVLGVKVVLCSLNVIISNSLIVFILLAYIM